MKLEWYTPRNAYWVHIRNYVKVLGAHNYKISPALWVGFGQKLVLSHFCCHLSSPHACPIRQLSEGSFGLSPCPLQDSAKTLAPNLTEETQEDSASQTPPSIFTTFQG